MKMPHPYFFYQLSFKLTQPGTQKLIATVAKEVLTWQGVTAGIHAMGAEEFLFQKKEIGHIHWNGDLDIMLGKQLTAALLAQNLVQQHKFVPEIAITYPLTGAAAIPFAITLLRFSYLTQIKKDGAANQKMAANTIKEFAAISFYPLVEHLV